MRQIHIINPMWEASGGSEWRSLELYRELQRHAGVKIWSEYPVGGKLGELVPVHSIRPARLAFPRTGTFIIVGVYFRIGGWYRYTMPRRVILIHNVVWNRQFHRKLRFLSRNWRRPVEVVYASELTRRITGWPGRVEASPVDLQRFRPARPGESLGERPFTVGRMSRDTPLKHGAGDPALYMELARTGVKVRLMGATCLADQFASDSAVELLPSASLDAAEFLRSLDCFFYRTSVEWLETFGRVVMEAMACGLPVVCERRGGAEEWIEHGKNGFLFDTDEEARDILVQLHREPELRARIGNAARKTAERIYSTQSSNDRIRFYLR